MLQSESKEAKRRKHSPQDLQALRDRAAKWGEIGGIGRAAIHAQADAAYQLSLDFFRMNAAGADFPRWLSQQSDVAYSTCFRRYKAGIARAAGSKKNRNLTGLLAEQRERELTSTASSINWNED